MPGAIESLEESEAATDAMVNCLERIINPEGDNDIFSTLSAQTIEELETIYDILISGRLQLEEDDPEEEERPKQVTRQSIAALKRRIGRARGVGMGSPKGAHRGKKPSQFDR
jgi:hypothetical protein